MRSLNYFRMMLRLGLLGLLALRTSMAVVPVGGRILSSVVH